jgi:hypothetical protein
MKFLDVFSKPKSKLNNLKKYVDDQIDIRIAANNVHIYKMINEYKAKHKHEIEMLTKKLEDQQIVINEIENDFDIIIQNLLDYIASNSHTSNDNKI